MTNVNRNFHRRAKAIMASALLASATLLAAPASAAITVASDPILYWNSVAIANSSSPTPVQARALAMANIAMADAVNAALGGPNGFYLPGVANSGGDARAAAAVATRNVLAGIYSTDAARVAALDTALTAYLALVPDSAAKTNGIATGAAYASAILTQRAGDGSAAVVTYTTTGLPGDWRPTPTGFAPAVQPQYGDVTPFLSSSDNWLRPGPPPTLGSTEYRDAYNEVKMLGAATGSTRTVDQTAAAQFWGPIGAASWLTFALGLSEDEGLSTAQYATLFGRLATSQADAIFAAWDAKYFYRFWRPVTAIREGDADGNPFTAGDATWSPLSNTPANPSYFSTASALSESAINILLPMIGDEGFCGTIGAGSRCFTSLGEAATESEESRIWSGIHFRFDIVQGRQVGVQIANRVNSISAFAPVPEPGSWALMIAGFVCAGIGLRTRRRAMGVQTI